MAWSRLSRVGWRNPWLPVTALGFAWLVAWVVAATAGAGRWVAPASTFAELSTVTAWVLGVVVAGLSVYTYLAAFSLLRLGMLVRGTPTSKLDTAAQGLVEVTGKAMSFDAGGTRAPESGMPCVWYSSSVLRDDGWFQVHHMGWLAAVLAWLALHLSLLPGRTSTDSLVLMSPHGECVIDPVGAFVLAGRTQFGANYREDLIRPGDPLFVLGSLQTRQHDTASLRQAAIQGRAGELLVAWKRDPDDLRRRFDIQGEHPTTDEWERVRTAAFEAAVAEAGPEQARDPDADITHCLARPDDGQPFLIAAMDEAAVLRRLDIGMGLNFVAGLLSGVALVRVLLS